MSENTIKQGRCTCGSVDFYITEPAIFRVFCHCSLCQEYENAPFADVSVFYARSVTAFDDSKISYKCFKKPAVVQRGSCKQCNDAVLEKIGIPLMPKMIVVSSNNIQDTSLLLAPSMHMFYDKRVADIEDNLKKYKGFASSQLAFGAALIKGMVAHSKAVKTRST